METEKIYKNTKHIWLCGNTECSHCNITYSSNEIIGMFRQNDNKYADIMQYEEGKYTLTLDYCREYNGKAYICYWYMEAGSFEPNIEIIGELNYCEPFEFYYRKNVKDRYFGGLAICVDCDIFDEIENIFEHGSLEIEYTGFPKSIDNSILIIDDIAKNSVRFALGGTVLRGISDSSGKKVFDKLDLLSGTVLRYINPEIDNYCNFKENPQKYILHNPAIEKLPKKFLPELFPGYSVSSVLQIITE